MSYTVSFVGVKLRYFNRDTGAYFLCRFAHMKHCYSDGDAGMTRGYMVSTLAGSVAVW